MFGTLEPMADIPARIHLAVSQMTSMFRSELRGAATSHELKLVQLEALIYFGRANRYSDTPAALGEYLGLTKGTVSQSVAALERRGLIEKTTDSRDRRRQHCALTKAGAAILKDVLPLTYLPSGEKDASALEGVVRQLQEANGYRSFGVCRTCRLHEVKGNKAVCGLTKESLNRQDAKLICREHEVRESA